MEMSRYFFDQEQMKEMYRLTIQDRYLSRMIELVPASSTPFDAILDIACGPGSWVREVAKRFPESQVVSIDLSERMVDYAAIQSEHLNTVQFQVMDATAPLDFPDGSFDLVNARLVFGFLDQQSWPRLLSEGARVLRAGRAAEGDRNRGR